ncbi:hypothetical protein BT96DRAFT_960804 [Gymnopus androsaceus JB14]|uniref:ARM repeat-containing protein n=1 Tax=Gymnopus androsaceus JB14 TaxID=1447944 RepID=A0A6A4GI00_9AGAR|nr:hypothetical protein BT96DRAFT_960804 [Gymnopus androsaceus JB14]
MKLTISTTSPNLAASWSSTPHLVPRKPPTQLAIVLQVLLSQPHHLRALILLSQFVDLGYGPSIFPDLRPVIYIHMARKFSAVDPTVQVDLFNNQQGYRYFSKILTTNPSTTLGGIFFSAQHALPNTSEHLAMCRFILASLARDFAKGQQACWEEQTLGVSQGTQDKLLNLISDDSAEVRCAALYALGMCMGASGSKLETEGIKGGGGSGGMFNRDGRTHFQMEVAAVTGARLVSWWF